MNLLCMSFLRLISSLHFFHSIPKTKLVLIFYNLCVGITQESTKQEPYFHTTPQYRVILYISSRLFVNKKIYILVFIKIIYYNDTIYWVMLLIINYFGGFAMLGIIGAMDVEVDALKNKVKNGTVSKLSGIDFVCGFIEEVMVCVAQCSPGKVNAAICTQAMIDNFDIDAIINIGVACSLNKDVVIKNVVLATDVCEYDMDITALGEPRGFINGLNVIKIKTDSALSEALSRTAINCGEKIHRGTVASGDTFIADDTLKAELAQEFDAICGEMEGGAIGHCCACAGVPFAVLRTISDGGDSRAQMDYPTFKRIAAEVSIRIILEFIRTQQNQISLF